MTARTTMKIQRRPILGKRASEGSTPIRQTPIARSNNNQKVRGKRQRGGGLAYTQIWRKIPRQSRRWVRSYCKESRVVNPSAPRGRDTAVACMKLSSPRRRGRRWSSPSSANAALPTSQRRGSPPSPDHRKVSTVGYASDMSSLAPRKPKRTCSGSHTARAECVQTGEHQDHSAAASFKPGAANRVTTTLPSSVFHTRTSPSKLPVARRLLPS